jgi:protein O-mannosyl-transferase
VPQKKLSQRMSKNQNRKTVGNVTSQPKAKTGEKQASKTLDTQQRSSFWTSRLPILAVLLVTFFAFLPAFQNEFVNWDDDINITDNKYIRALTLDNIVGIFTTDVIGGYNPLPILTFAIERALFGVENLSQTIHINNLILHLICVFLAWRLATLLGLKPEGALLLAFLFGIHPMRTESVAWATERKDVLFATFYFASLIQYVKYLKSENYTFSNRYFLYSFAFFIVALFSKVQSVALPLSLLALDYFYHRPLKFNLILEKSLFWLGSLAMGLGNVFLLVKKGTIDNDVTDYSFFERVAVATYSYMIYLGKLVYPWVMSPIYPYPKDLAAYHYTGLLVFGLSVASIVWAFKQQKTIWVFGWLFFFFNYVFVSQILGAGQGYLADRFTYVPYFGFFFIVAYYAQDILAAKVWAKGVAAAYLILCFTMTYAQTQVWRNSEVLWTKALEYDIKSTTPYANRGIYKRDKKRFVEAITDFTTALSLKPTAATYNSRGKAHFDYGASLSRAGKTDSGLYHIRLAINDYTMGIAKDTTMEEIWANRGAAYGQISRIDSAFIDFNKAISIDSLHLNSLKNRSIAHQVAGNFEAALADNRCYLRQDDSRADMWFDQGSVLFFLKRYAEALPALDRAIKLDALNGSYFATRARTHAALGNRAAARADAQAAQQRGIKMEAEFL